MRVTFLFFPRDVKAAAINHKSEVSNIPTYLRAKISPIYIGARHRGFNNGDNLKASIIFLG